MWTVSRVSEVLGEALCGRSGISEALRGGPAVSEALLRQHLKSLELPVNGVQGLKRLHVNIVQC